MTAGTTPSPDNERGADVVPLHQARSRRAREAALGDWHQFDRSAEPDPLTSLHGHPWFEEDLRGAARRRRGSENPWVAVAAVEGLPGIEERLGLEAATEALRAVSVSVQDVLRSGDKVSRIGSERFGLIVDAPYAGEAMAALERIGRAVRELATAEPRWSGLGLRIGLSPLWSDDPSAALAQASAALEDGRRNGRVLTMSTSSRPEPG
jgi:GGDEF domain-containing protein